ncbi:hypothetical protein ABPG73_023103, partial [Tetrahymena malaccensis]
YKQIGANEVLSVISALKQCTKLLNLTLQLTCNQIGDIGASGLGSALANCHNLSNCILSIVSNNIGENGVSGLAQGLANYSILQEYQQSLDGIEKLIGYSKTLEYQIKSLKAIQEERESKIQEQEKIIKELETKITKLTKEMQKNQQIVNKYIDELLTVILKLKYIKNLGKRSNLNQEVEYRVQEVLKTGRNN